MILALTENPSSKCEYVAYIYTVRRFDCICANPPTPLVGAGRAIGAFAVELCTLAKTSYAYSSARGVPGYG